jgi:hypothetical protein
MRRPLLVVLLALPFGAPAAQETQEPLERPTPGFTGRDRDMLHPGDPLRIVGIEQEENAIRARTPALERSDRRVALVQEDELRERKLAMFSGATLRVAPSRVEEPRERKSRRREPAPARPGRDALEEGSGTGWLPLAFGAALVGLVVWFVLRRKPAPPPARSRG